MASSDSVRTPTAVSEETNLETVKVKVVIDGIAPPTFGDKKKAKNGDVNVAFSSYGLDVGVVLRKSSGQETKFSYVIKKLPSEIVPAKCTWKVEKGLVTVTLSKKGSVSWVPMLRRGLEQADSDDSDEG